MEKNAEKEMVCLVVKVESGKEDAVLAAIRSHGFRANLLIGFYDIFVDVPSNIGEYPRYQKEICQISGVVQLAFVPDRRGELKHVS